MLRSALQGHPDLHCESEIFLFAHDPGQIRLVPPALRTAIRRAPEVAAVKTFLHKPSVRAAGFTLFYDQMREPGQQRLWSFLADFPDLLILHLTRRDTFMQWLSLEEAMTSNLWLIQNGQSHPPPPPITLDPHRFFDWCDRIQSFQDFALRHLGHHPRIEVDYDDLTDHFDRVMNEVQIFLGLDPRSLTSTCKKIATRPLPERIANLPAFLDAIQHHHGANYVQQALARDALRHRAST